MRHLVWLALPALLLPALLLVTASPLAARDYGSLYDAATLAEWRARYRPGILGNLREVIRPNLRPAELAALEGLEIDLPLRAASGAPLDFYALRPRRVVLPVLSLKFFDDLSIAYAWLWRRGYSVETVLEYVGLLKYGREADYGRWPAPLEALQIPADALDDPEVDSLSQKIFKSAVVFILLHEMGHILHDHPGYGPAVARSQARANEAEADAFALEVMRRLPAQPTGMFLFFQTLVYFGANRGDYASEADYRAALEGATHPLTAERMSAIAQILRSRAADFAAEYRTPAEGVAAAGYLADQIDGVADLVADPDLQRLIARTSRSATLAGLAPRRAGELLGSGAVGAAAGATSVAPDAAFAGVYDGTLTAAGTDFAVRLILQRDGARVAGLYNYGAGVGELVGVVEGRTAYFTWRSGGERGRARLTLESGRLSGRWGYRESDSDGGSWSLVPAGE